MSLEVFKDIPGYDGYQVSSWGRVYNSKTGIFIRPEVYEELDSCFGEEQQHGDEHDLIYLGNYRITFFCPEECCCGSWAGSPTASGAWPTSNHTVACGEDIPFGTTLLIDGQVYVCEDRGVPSGCVDIFVDSHSEAEQRGLYYTDVYIVR